MPFCPNLYSPVIASTIAYPPVVPGNHADMNASDLSKTSLIIIGLPDNRTVTSGIEGYLPNN